MEKERVEKSIPIATRVPPGDNWSLDEEEKSKVYPSITHALEAWFDKHNENVEFRLAPLEGKLYVIVEEEREIEPPVQERFNIYGDPAN